MRAVIYGKRTIKELLRDPLSYIFCLGFPMVMLMIMTMVYNSLPEEAGVAIFRIDNLAPGVAVFGLTFVMLFTSLQVSKDRTTSFMTRLYASPMKPADFILGYTVPVIILSIAQQFITFAAAIIIGKITGVNLSLSGMLLCILVLLPSAFMYIGFGILFGTLLSDKSAPGICSIIITGAGMLGGIWMPVEMMGGTFLKVCELLPFLPGVSVARSTFLGDYNNFLKFLVEILVYGVVLYFLAIIIFRRKMKSDQK